jgi:hypothetical protein
MKIIVTGTVSHAGKTYEPDKNGVVDVPDEAAAVLIESHGAQPAEAPEKPKPDKK